MLAEQQTEWVINNNLVNKGWCINEGSQFKNVYFQKPPYAEQQNKLGGKKPDYILYQTGTNRPIAIIEAKKGGDNLQQALEQATEYAKLLDVSLVFAMNGSYCETRFVPNNKELILNGEEVRELIREKEVLAFLDANSNESWTIPQEVKVSRDELISQFKNLNDVLRSEGLRAGIERFSEFANILFLKLLSEDTEKSWWNSIKSQSNDHIIGYINGYVIEQVKKKYGGDVFTPILIKNPQTLRHIIDAIDPLVLSTIDTDIKGDAFEYFLEKTASTENDLGEYFTPRNVVKTIINLVDPKFKESVYDPFCGTGGFLTEAFNYIKENNIIEPKEDLERLKQHTLYGREITTTARIAKMNMVLHGDGHSGIEQTNTLINPDYILQNGNVKKFDIIVTNMPFSQTITRKITENGKVKIENNISPLYYNGIAKNNGDTACVLHCLRALKEGGRMALVVPEGFLFRKDIANVRKFLLSKAKLQSVISLPQGTFLPYTGVKTDILYFTDAHKPNNQKNYWFFEAKNIGVTLDNHKRKIKGNNDLKKIESSDIKKVDKNPSLQDNMLEIGFEIVDLEKVKNNDYNLVGNFYRSTVKSNGIWQIVSLSSVLDTIETGSRPKGGINTQDTGSISLGGEQIGRDGRLELSKIPFVPIEFYNKSTRGLVKDHDILICKDGALTGKVCVVDMKMLPTKEVMINEHVFILRCNPHKMNQYYLFYCIYSEKVQTQIKNLAYNKSAQPGLNREHINLIKIPIPALDEQQKIVNELDGYQSIIQGAKQIIENWKPHFEVDNNWGLESLGNLCQIRPKKLKLNKELEVSFIDMAMIPVNGYKFLHFETRQVSDVEKGYTYFEENDVLFAKITPCFENGKCGIATNLKNGVGFGSTEFIVLRCNENLLPEYLYTHINSDIFRYIGKNFMSGTAGQQRVSLDFVKNYQIPLPPLHIQEEIVKQLEIERKMIEQQKDVIKLFEAKVQNKLNALWQTKEQKELIEC